MLDANHIEKEDDYKSDAKGSKNSLKNLTTKQMKNTTLQE